MTGPASSTAFKIRVLVVDDQRTMRLIIRQLLAQSGIEDVIEAENGVSAIELLAGVENMSPPDIIICDLHMDRMDGMEFLNRVRRGRVNVDPRTPFLVLTGEPDRFVLSVTEQVGATSVLRKPISATDLGNEIGRAIGLKS